MELRRRLGRSGAFMASAGVKYIALLSREKYIQV
jgi:hypothetical protein